MERGRALFLLLVRSGFLLGDDFEFGFGRWVFVETGIWALVLLVLGGGAFAVQIEGLLVVFDGGFGSEGFLVLIFGERDVGLAPFEESGAELGVLKFFFELLGFHEVVLHFFHKGRMDKKWFISGGINLKHFNND